ncbi:MAG: enoyl-CoA hydratase/isomerase family protein [Bacteriovoracaceae bacterium]|nr:enoyl-CoA hydratase/isomerase family protein [Bacteriovoracaceae bacterium]
MTYKKISYEIKDNVAYIGLGHNDHKAMIVIDEDLLVDLEKAVGELSKDIAKLKGMILFSHNPNVFAAGADINIISSFKDENEAAAGAAKGQAVFNLIEDLKIHTVACVDGVCLGGGLELALVCDTILVSDNPKTSLGLPEVQLGLIPGFGGTYRLPKKLGLPTSLDLILSGKKLNAKRAKKYGIASEVYPSERLLDMATKHLSDRPKKSTLKKSLTGFASSNFITKKIFFQKAREAVLKKTMGLYQAPLKIINVLEEGDFDNRKNYLNSEASAFGELCMSEQSRNLRHLFFLMEGAKKFDGDKGSSDTAKNFKRGAALGAGTMGGGITWLMADNAMMPIMKDLEQSALELGLKQSSAIFSGAKKRKKIDKATFIRKQRSITPQLSYSGFKNVDLIIEAVVENIDIKKKVFAELEEQISDNCIVASNTSALSINEMASTFKKSNRFAGLHFFNPVNRMPLVEIITHDRVAPETVYALYQWCLKVKKTPIVVKDAPGFLVNRILVPYISEAFYLAQEGVPIIDIERACLNFGMPMGPFRLSDEVGLDVGIKIGKILQEGLGERFVLPQFTYKLVGDGFLGKKNNRGLYTYSSDGKEDGLNEAIDKYLTTNKVKMDEIEIQMRVFLPMINEAASILEEGIVKTPGEVDLGLIFGIGFPPFRGGILRYADSEGLDRILGAIERFSKDVSNTRYAPSAYLKKLVEEKRTFY